LKSCSQFRYNPVFHRVFHRNWPLEHYLLESKFLFGTKIMNYSKISSINEFENRPLLPAYQDLNFSVSRLTWSMTLESSRNEKGSIYFQFYQVANIESITSNIRTA
jgi:hypothetical protein